MTPSFELFLYPVLYALKDGKPMKREELRDACAKLMNLTQEDLEEKISSGKKHKIVDRIQWATYYLIKTGLLTRTDHATEQITEEGKKLLASGVTTINRQFLREHYETYRIFEQQTREAAKLRLAEKKNNKKKKNKGKKENSEQRIERKNTHNETSTETRKKILNTNMTHSPSFLDAKLSQIEQDINSLSQGLVCELRDIINDFDKESFRCLLLDLIPKMGYSSIFKEFSLNAKIAHDITLSGFINIDEMGLNRFFVLAHNKTTDDISQMDVQSFIGALSSIGINLGVYITTSQFSPEAITYQTYGSVRCVLIDGLALAKLMVKFNIGVITRKVFTVKDVDQEYLFTRLTHSIK